MSDWLNVPEDISKYVGFIYRITNLTNGKYYIGKKKYWHYETFVKPKPITKVEQIKHDRVDALIITKGQKEKLHVALRKDERARRKNFKKQTYKKLVEFDWKDYYGSSKKMKLDIAELGENKFKREIIKNCETQFELTYQELLSQLEYDVLFDPMSYNELINIRLQRDK